MMIERFEEFLSARSLTERLLLSLLLLVIAIYFLNPIFLQKFNHLSSLLSTFEQKNLQTQNNINLQQALDEQKNLHSKLSSLSSTLGTHPPSSSTLLKLISESIQTHSLTLKYSSIQNHLDSYSIHLQAQGEFQDLLHFLNSILAIPWITIHSFTFQESLLLDLILIPKSPLPPHSKIPSSLSPRSIEQLLQKQLNSPLSLSPINPFIHHNAPLILEAIFNHKAKINGAWIKQGDKINGYTLKLIAGDFVVLEKQKESKKLLLKTQRIFQ